MTFRVSVDRNAFRDALMSLKKITKAKGPFEVILSFFGGVLNIQAVGGSRSIEAQGSASVDVHLFGGAMFGLASVLPEVSPLELQLSGENLRLDTLYLPCSTTEAKPFYVQLPINPRLPDVLCLRYRHSINEISRSGFGKQFMDAEKERELMVKKAARILAPLGVTSADISAFIEAKLKKHAGV